MIFNRPRAKKKQLTWVIKKEPDTDFFYYKTVDVNFTCNGVSYARIYVDRYSNRDHLRYAYLSNGNWNATIVYTYHYVTGSSSWNEQYYRTITFDAEPTGDLLTWLEANATPQ